MRWFLNKIFKWLLKTGDHFHTELYDNDFSQDEEETLGTYSYKEMLLLLKATDSFETVTIYRRWELDAIWLGVVGKSWYKMCTSTCLGIKLIICAQNDVSVCQIT